MATVGPAQSRYARRRLARIQKQRPGALKHIDLTRVNPREAHRVRVVAKRLHTLHGPGGGRGGGGAGGGRGSGPAGAPAWTRRPVVPGSSMTKGELSKAAWASAKTTYGPKLSAQRQAVGQAKTYARDVGGPGGFYDQYLGELAKHTQNVTTAAQQANQAVGQLPGQVTGLAQADLSSLQGQANAGAAARGVTPAGNLAGMASDATAVRQAMAGSFGAQQAAQNAAAQNYADTLAHVVGATQKLSGQAVAAGKVRTARANVAETLGEKGAAVQKYKTETKADEAKNVLAMQIASGKTAAELATAAETARHHRAQERASSASTKAQLRKARIQAAGADDKRASSGPFAGLTQKEIKGLSDSRAQSLVNKYNRLTHPPRAGRGGRGGGSGGGNRATPTQQMGIDTGFQKMLVYAKHFAGKKMPRSKAYNIMIAGQQGVPSAPSLAVSLALDQAYDGFIHPSGIRQLNRRGYKIADLRGAKRPTASAKGSPYAQTIRDLKNFGRSL